MMSRASAPHAATGELMRTVFVILLFGLAVCPSPGSSASTMPTPSGCGPAPTVLENPPEMTRVDGRIQAIELEARQDGDRLCFVDRNSSDRPGIAPTIRIRPGETLRVRLFNRINDASVLRKTTGPGHATNFPGIPDMPGYFEVRAGAYHEPTGNTNLHFHGLEVRPVPCGPGVAPGDDVVTTHFVPEGQASPPGACKSAYEIAVPEEQPAGLYWYHTHFHGESEAQTLLGLSGAIVVENADDDARRQHEIAERILIVRDHPAPEPEDAAAPKPAQFDPHEAVQRQKPAITMPRAGAAASTTTDQLPQCGFGKCINTAAQIQCSASDQDTILSVNGVSIRDARNPAGTVPEIGVSAGREELWRLVNAAANTYVRLHLTDIDNSGIARSIPITVVGLDGMPFADKMGRPETQTSTDPIIVPPGGRIEFNVKLDVPPAQHRIVLRTEPVETGCAGDLMPARDLVAVRVNVTPSDALRGQRSVLPRTVHQHVDDGSSENAIVRRRTFAFTEYQRAKSSKTDFYITEVSRPDAIIEPYPMEGSPSSVVEVEPDSVEEWTILNFTHEIHNFHIHQLHFRVLESDDKFIEGRMLDTINVPVALPDANWSPNDPVTPGSVRLLMRFRQNISGEFVFHCHILGHEDKGMMGLIRVIDPGQHRSPSSESRSEHHH
jgi:FtsP/CotA-like multicopper oxidase with cupredoxin domain